MRALRKIKKWVDPSKDQQFVLSRNYRIRFRNLSPPLKIAVVFALLYAAALVLYVAKSLMPSIAGTS